MSTAPRRPGARGPTRSSGPQIDDDEILDDERDAEGREQLEQLGRAVDAAQQHDLDQRADQPRRRARAATMPPQKPSAPASALGQRIGDVGAQHVEGAVGEVHDPRDAEDDRQARRDEEQRRRARRGPSGTGRRRKSTSAPRGSLVRARPGAAGEGGGRRDVACRGDRPLRTGRGEARCASLCGRSFFTSSSGGRYFAPSR